MTRSKRKTPIAGAAAAGSEKDDKQASHRKLRRAVRQLIPSGKDDTLPVEQELTNPWSMAKDGKLYFDPANHPRLMRK
ncbi:hypothetical protein [Novilysobacter spongiicola]|uniref:Uncharacterized protein n=1 Tax=Lysobacter spongiicola DSM 21749 TaxID=1122188 RepID=A0A1T4QSW1_9GAMM|nr:hypothetical protein [Lysobacter spongiicola]SKA06368.1 hypothetical protein SAMN02745674_01788 [Lysobacter spongiicola DSM 21749]